MTGGLVVCGLALLVGVIVAVAEWRFRARWRETVSPSAAVPLALTQAIHHLRERWPQAMNRVRVVRVDEAPGPAPKIGGWSTVQRSLTWIGTRLWVVHVDPRDPGPVLIHEVVQHVLPHSRGEGWNRDHGRADLEELQRQIQREIWGPTGRP